MSAPEPPPPSADELAAALAHVPPEALPRLTLVVSEAAAAAAVAAVKAAQPGGSAAAAGQVLKVLAIGAVAIQTAGAAVTVEGRITEKSGEALTTAPAPAAPVPGGPVYVLVPGADGAWRVERVVLPPAADPLRDAITALEAALGPGWAAPAEAGAPDERLRIIAAPVPRGRGRPRGR